MPRPVAARPAVTNQGADRPRRFSQNAKPAKPRNKIGTPTIRPTRSACTIELVLGSPNGRTASSRRRNTNLISWFSAICVLHRIDSTAQTEVKISAKIRPTSRMAGMTLLVGRSGSPVGGAGLGSVSVAMRKPLGGYVSFLGRASRRKPDVLFSDSTLGLTPRRSLGTTTLALLQHRAPARRADENSNAPPEPAPAAGRAGTADTTTALRTGRSACFAARCQACPRRRHRTCR